MRSAARTLAGLALASTSVLPLSLVAADRASATPSSTVCHGYAACSVGRFTTHGYLSHAGSSYWNMYAGNNCTNYVAFVESSVYGVAAPPFALGDAGAWPVSAPRLGALVDHTPSVGAVAQWDGGSPGIPSPGHVAIVEEVGPRDSYVVVSQQHVSDVDGYDWIRIDANPSANEWEQWPSAFIHFPRAPRGLRVAASTAFQWVSLRVVPTRFERDNLVLSDGADQVVTPGRPVSLIASGPASVYRIRFQDPTLGSRVVLRVAGGASSFAAHLASTSGPGRALRVRFSRASGGGARVVTLVARPVRPASVAASSPAPATAVAQTTTTTSPPAGPGATRPS